MHFKCMIIIIVTFLLCSLSDMKKIQYIETKLEQLYNNCSLKSFDNVWIEGDLCIAQYHANKKWYRGKIVKIRENDIIDVKI